ncbi:hypothetical protein G6F57_009600 [Rhizopus arrhizus]|uniref:Uncharacterized protein n=1 Tax=Rhizopus oryzae TaxID=64495 RepID=A0A9P7BNY8_RHIOR|nr:hypothetical protein G6F24_011380 [Rhizopus arrhizus]KAG1395280.1 hypothetical protein G6F58_011963 [Rhizopus delemar]KAG0771918.1 hypothetical protein G6F22_016102 [Rhizopus arrhizus]KAG0782143.1 hypothetical protein G6F21_011275 [Rhizopus arrhizus]KAG0807031.1 hypothetical protein G6F20_010662 [Rhizopus arrhizus]
MDRNVTDHKIDTVIDSFELYVEDNSDDDFQPVVTARKRKSRENTPQSESQKRLKGKGKVTDSEATTTSSNGISTTDETIMFNMITLDDYDLEYNSDDFDAPVVKRPFLGESTKSAFRMTKLTSAAPSKPVPTAFNSAATSVKSSFYPVPVDKASDIKEGPKKISMHCMI